MSILESARVSGVGGPVAGDSGNDGGRSMNSKRGMPTLARGKWQVASGGTTWTRSEGRCILSARLPSKPTASGAHSQ